MNSCSIIYNKRYHIIYILKPDNPTLAITLVFIWLSFLLTRIGTASLRKYFKYFGFCIGVPRSYTLSLCNYQQSKCFPTVISFVMIL